MRIGIWNNYAEYASNRIFDPGAYAIGDDLGYPLRHLREALATEGHSLDTLDLEGAEPFDRVIFFDYPDDPNYQPERYTSKGIPCYLVLAEVEIVNPKGYDRGLHVPFRKVFTYDDSLAGAGGKYRLYRLPHKLTIDEKAFGKGLGDRPGFAVMIAGDKSSRDPRELYSERRRVIEWCEAHRPDAFDLFGFGWIGPRFHGPRLVRALNRIGFLRKRRPSYRGSVDSKVETLSRYRFSICYENARSIPGYVTEKLFDSMVAGCIPVYRGAPNIANLVDPATHLDATAFPTVGALFERLENITPAEFRGYQERIRSYLGGGWADPFSAEAFVAIIRSEILRDAC